MLVRRQLSVLMRRNLFRSLGSEIGFYPSRGFISDESDNHEVHNQKSSHTKMKAIALAVGIATTAAVTWEAIDSKNMNVDPEFIKMLKRYMKDNFEGLALPKQIIQQLAFLQANAIKTSESNVRLANKEPDNLHIEIKRALTRWYCLKLLLDGGVEAYQKFTRAQSNAEKLSNDSFEVLSRFLNRLSPAAKHVIEITCFLTISDHAKDLAKTNNAKFSPDSEKFLTDTITQCIDIYPAVALLNAEAKNLLPAAYLPDTHGRHMLYTEGGNNMFAELRKRFREKSISDAEYQIWFARWIINIAGFRGHENPHGSLYLTEKTALALFDLCDEIDRLKRNSEYDVLSGYLHIRAKNLGVKNLYLAHLGASMRLYTKEQGSELQAWFDALAQSHQVQLVQGYDKIRKTLKVTPTYQVAVLDNLLALGCSIAETLNIHAKISARAERAYTDDINEHKISASTPLCFREIAFKENLLPIVEVYRASGEIPLLHLDAQGNVLWHKVDYEHVASLR